MDAVVVTANRSVNDQLIRSLPLKTRVIATYSLGTDHIDLKAAEAAGKVVIAVPDVLSESCAATATLLMLAASRRAIEGTKLVRSGDWGGWSPGQLLRIDVHGARLGILGMRRIGRAVARRAHGFSMEICYHVRSRLDASREEGARFEASLTNMLAQIDFLCVACPGTSATKGLIDRETTNAMPRGSVIVNISRGDVMDDYALIAGLKSGHIFAAGLDVSAGEPDMHPAYRSLDNVFI